MEDVWGLRVGTVRQLSSERDANILLDDRYVLKVSNPAEDPAVVDMENAAMAHAARVAADLPLPAVIPAASGASVTGITDDTGAACLARLITVVPGAPAEGRPVTTDLAGQIGAVAARTSVALHGLFHRAGAVLTGYQRHRPLTPPETDVLGDLLIARLALTLAISQRRLTAHDDNPPARRGAGRSAPAPPPGYRRCAQPAVLLPPLAHRPR